MKKIVSFLYSILRKIWKRKKPLKNQPFHRIYRYKGPSPVAPPSLKQKKQIEKFKMTTKLLKPMFEFLPVTYRNVSGRATARSKAFSYNIRNAIKGEFPNLTIDHEAVKVSKGNLYNSSSSTAYVSERKIHFNGKNLQINNANDDDIAVLIAYCPERQKCVYNLTGPKREEEKAVLDVKQFKNQEVHTYLSFVSANGNLVADSKYTGRFIIK